MRGLVRFLVVRLELVLEQALELVRIEVAADDEPQAVRDELHHVMVGEDLRIFLEEGALVGRLEIVLDRHHAFLADLHQDVVEQLEECDVVLALVARALGQGERALERGLHDLGRIAGEERAERRAHDDDDLARMPQGEQMCPPSRMKPPSTHTRTTTEPMI